MNEVSNGTIFQVEQPRCDLFIGTQIPTETNNGGTHPNYEYAPVNQRYFAPKAREEEA